MFLSCFRLSPTLLILIAGGLLLGEAVPPVLAGTSYQQAVGTPPVVTSLAWRSWYYSLLNFRRQECPIVRPASYHFSQSGSDAGPCSASQPCKTIARAYGIIQANPAGDYALLFKRGDIWRNERMTYTFAVLSSKPSSISLNNQSLTVNFQIGQTLTAILPNGATQPVTVTGAIYNTNVATVSFTPALPQTPIRITYTGLATLNLNAPNLTWGAWGGGGRKPVFSAFNTAYNVSSWQNSAQRGDSRIHTESIPEGGDVAYFRETNDVSKPYRRMDSIADVDATPGSWYLDRAAKVLYAHGYGDRTIGGSNDTWESVYSNDASFWIRRVDGTRIDGVRIDGYGAKGILNPENQEAYGIHGGISGTESCVVSNTESYYNTYHAIGVLGDGGIVTYDHCRVGLGGDFVSYSGPGGTELIVNECEAFCTGLPTGTRPFSNNAVTGGPMTQHGGGVTLYPYAAGQNTLRLGTGYVGIVPGEVMTLTGGTNETLTVQTFDSSTNTITFTSPIQQSGHAHLMVDGAALDYSCALCVCYGCRNSPSIWQTGPFGNFAQSVPYWTDLADCRCWTVGEQWYVRTPAPLDNNRQTYPVTSQFSDSVTLGGTPPVGLPQQYQWVRLTGGPSGPEDVRVSSSAGGTIRFSTQIVGPDRTAAEFEIGPGANSVTLTLGPSKNVLVNCCYQMRALNGLSAYSSLGFITIGAGKWVMINCTLDADLTQRDSYHRYPVRNFLLNQASEAAAQFYNCRFNIKTDNGVNPVYMDNLAGTGKPASRTLIANSILSAETTSAEASLFVPGLGNSPQNQLTNAYVGATTISGTGGYDQDPFYVELGAGLPLFGHPNPDSVLLSPDSQLVQGKYRLEYDADWLPRSSSVPAIGPYEPVKPTSDEPSENY